MQGVDPNAFRLDVDTSEFTRALKHLRRLRVRADLVHLTYESGMLANWSDSDTFGQLVAILRSWFPARRQSRHNI